MVKPRKGKGAVLERAVNVSVFANCLDPKTKKVIQMGSSGCIDCFQKILRESKKSCAVYDQGMYLKKATLLEAEKIVTNVGGQTGIPQPYTSTMHG